MFAAATTQTTLQQVNDSVRRTTDALFNGRSLFIFFCSIVVAVILGRIIAFILRRLTRDIGRRVDETRNLKRANKLRRTETLIVLSIAIIKTLLIVAAIYFWWIFTHPDTPPTAIIGGSVLVAVFATGAITPLLRDLTYGSVMMAEHWFGVGDYVRIDPFSDLQGVVDRVTLRSTRIRGLNGEVIWINNQNIQAVRLTPKGIRRIAIELLVNDLQRGLDLIDQTNLRLPNSPLMLLHPLVVTTKQEVGNNLWHITAIGETAPGREWVLEKYALRIIQEVDDKRKSKVMLHEPIARNADAEAEQRFTRTIRNATKPPSTQSSRVRSRSKPRTTGNTKTIKTGATISQPVKRHKPRRRLIS